MTDEVLDIFIDVPDDTSARTDLLAEFTALRTDISALPVVRVETGTLLPSPGTKAVNAIDITHLVVTLVPSTALITAVARICVERIRAGAARELYLKVGDNELRLTGVDSEAQAKTVEEWARTVHGDGHAT
ncbi:MAG TPA: hypothetical protein VHO29_13000 [Marmoricola sp.]|nr:hypothetical protein [Marmoricola sp.]